MPLPLGPLCSSVSLYRARIRYLIMRCYIKSSRRNSWVDISGELESIELNRMALHESDYLEKRFK